MTDKFCVNCKFCSKGGVIYYCNNPNNGTNIITGQIQSKFADTVRGSAVRCGVNGKWYEDNGIWYSNEGYLPWDTKGWSRVRSGPSCDV